MVTAGIYAVKEDGLIFQHDTSAAAIEANEPTTPEIFIQRFRKNFKLNILERPDENHLVVEFINIDVSYVNALRRILIAEVPTVAIETVYMFNNNGIIHDEVLAHRLGLVPLKIDPRYLEDFPSLQQQPPQPPPPQQQQQQQAQSRSSTTGGTDKNNNNSNKDDEQIVGPTPTDRNTVVFQLVVSCNKGDEENTGDNSKEQDDDHDPNNDDMERLIREEEKASVSNNRLLEEIAATTSTRSNSTSSGKVKYPSDRPYTKHVYSGDLKWLPQGNQEQILGETVGPIHDDIILAKLRPGQFIELEAFAQRGTGADHAKYSPVCTASYRLMPQITITKPIYDNDAIELVYKYEPGVFTLQPTSVQDGTDPIGTKVKAILSNPYACTMSRNYMKNPILAESIVMERLSNHFIFSIESVGQYPSPGVLLAEAIRVLQSKCQNIVDLIDEHTMKTEIS